MTDSLDKIMALVEKGASGLESDEPIRTAIAALVAEIEQLRKESEGIRSHALELVNEATLRESQLRAELEAEKAEVFRLQCSHSKLYGELEAARRDAERYRWIRRVDTWFKEQNMTPEEIDAAIDEAMTKK